MNMRTMALRRKKYFRGAFVKILLFHLLLCTGAFSGIALCIEKDGTFHVEFSPCEKARGADRVAANAFPMETYEPSGQSPSAPCESCVNSHDFTCIEDCENLTVRNAGGSLRNPLPTIHFQPSALVSITYVERTSHRLQTPVAANAAMDSLQTVVLLN